MNNIWDSMHRGLEKASQEAARIARVQHLRSTIHKQTLQMSEQEKELLNRTMQLFTSGTLLQPELLPLCQQLLQTHQQIVQAQNELQQIISQPPSTSPSATPPTSSAQLSAPSPNTYQSGQYTPATKDGSQPATPQYQAYTTSNIVVPPPPPVGETLTVSSHETLLIPLDAPAPSPPPPPAPGDAMLTISSRETFLMPGEAVIPPPPPGVAAYTQACPRCGTPAQNGNLYCQQCGTPLQGYHEEQKPTARAERSPALGDQTIYVAEDEPISTPEIPVVPPLADASDETIRKPTPPTPENNGGN